MRKSAPKRKRSSTRLRRPPFGWQTTTSHSPCERVGDSGVYETLRAYRGHVFALETHLDRLEASVQTVGWRLGMSRAQIAHTVQQRAHRLRRSDAAIRITAAVPRGQLRARATCTVMARTFTPRPAQWWRQGTTVCTTPGVRGTRGAVSPQVKHLDGLPGVLAVAMPGAPVAEHIYRLPGGYVGEGTVSNICVVTSARELLSAKPADGVLPGVVCHTLFRLAPLAGLQPRWTRMTRHEVWNAAEVFMSNSLFEVLPITRYDGRVIGTGRPGPATQDLHRLFRECVAEEKHDAHSTRAH